MRVLVLPVYNEERVIKDLIFEFLSSDPTLNILVIDDDSGDNTSRILDSINESRLTVIHNEANLGHGLSVTKGLTFALNMGAEVVLTADGDGNYLVGDVLNLLQTLENSNLHLVEGIRIRRDDPWFRRIASFTTRLLVFIRSKHRTKDANTPFHAFRAESLNKILSLIPESGKVIPNMYISSIIRRLQLEFASKEVVSNYREGNNPLGVTWNQKNRNIPSKRYIKFCLHAVFDWFTKT